MDIQFKLEEDGGFVVGDLMSGYTSYAYPTSPHAETARRHPERVAQEMILAELRHPAVHEIKSAGEYDALNWTRLNGGTNGNK